MADRFTALDPDLSGSFPAEPAEESEIIRLLKRGRVGAARVRLHKEKYWELDFAFPAGVSIKRFRRYFKAPTATYRAAIQITRELRRHGQMANSLDHDQRWVATECFRLLAPISDGSPTVLLDIVRDHLKRHPLAGNARTLDDVRRELVAKKAKGNRRERYVKDFDYKMRSLIDAIGNLAISSITTNQLEDEIAKHKWSPGTVHSVTQSWKIIFNYAVKRGYRLDNPCNKIELPERDQFEPQIFSVYDVRRMMALTLFDDRDPLLPECRAYAAIGVFAGIRPEEMVRLEWGQVDLACATITILGANAKCRARRIVDISPNLVEWLRPIYRKTGKVLTAPIAALRKSIRMAMKLAEWPHDVLRHSFGSYHFGHHRNEALVKNQMGHSDDGRMFYAHYRVLVNPKDAASFWKIYPPIALLECSALPA